MIFHGNHRHSTTEDYEACLRSERASSRIALTTLIVLAIMLAAASCLYAQLVYDDWTCGLPGVECRKIIP